MEKKALNVQSGKGVHIMTDIVDQFPNAKYRILDYHINSATKLAQAVMKIIANTDIYILKSNQYLLNATEDIAQARNDYDIPHNLAQSNVHIIRPIAIKELSDPAANILYIEILLEYGGEDLSTRIGNMQPPEVLDAIRQTLDALAFIESKGVFHSDIKPENIVSLNGVLKLIDFGISKDFLKRTQLVKATSRITGKVIGQTSRYSPPEIFTERAHYEVNKIDVYCWAMSFYQLITGISDDDLIKEMEDYRYDETVYATYINRVKGIHMSSDPALHYTQIIIPILVQALSYFPEQRPDFAMLKALFNHDLSLFITLKQALSMNVSHTATCY